MFFFAQSAASVFRVAGMHPFVVSHFSSPGMGIRAKHWSQNYFEVAFDFLYFWYEYFLMINFTISQVMIYPKYSKHWPKSISFILNCLEHCISLDLYHNSSKEKKWFWARQTVFNFNHSQDGKLVEIFIAPAYDSTPESWKKLKWPQLKKWPRCGLQTQILAQSVSYTVGANRGLIRES